MDILNTGMVYLSKNFSIIPVKKSKLPLIGWKEFQERKTTRDEIQQWFTKWPDANIAVVTGRISGIIVLDFDNEESFEKAKERGLPNTPLVKTGRGYHSYFKYQDGVRNFQKRQDLPGIDLRGDGGYAVLPPSVHENGRVYSWCEGKSLDDLALASLPEWILGKSGSTSVEDGPIPEHERNNTLTRLAGGIFRDSLDYFKGLERLKAINIERCKPPLRERDVEIIAESIYKTETRKRENAGHQPIEKKYFTLAELKNKKSLKIDWFWEGYLGRGFITLLSGLPKAGKTTLMFNLIRSIKELKPFLDKRTKSDGQIFIVTEENSQLYRDRLQKENLNSEEILICPAVEMGCGSRMGVITEIMQAINSAGVSLIVLDTLGEFWEVSDENDAPKVQAALKSFREIVQQHNVAMFLIHHLRKSEGDYGTAHRGSNALLAGVDIGLEFKYFKNNVPNRRILESNSRFFETPKKLVVELGADGYKALGDFSLFTKEEVKRQFLKAVAAQFEGLETIRARMNPLPSLSELREVASVCRREHLVDFTGQGRKGSPYMYKAIST